MALASAYGCAGGGGHTSPLQEALLRDNLEISPVIFLRDLMPTAEAMSILEFDEFIASSGVEVHGEGDGRFVHGSDLMRACGPDCSAGHGLGELLAQFAVRIENNRN